VPSDITTDRGTQFTAGTWSEWCKSLHIKHHMTTAFHPQANGMIERFHRQLKDALRAREAGTRWVDHLPWVMLGLRATPKDECGVSAAEATVGQQLVVPGQLQPVEAAPALRAAPPVIPATRRTYAQVVSGDYGLKTADFVYIRKDGVSGPLEKCYSGPYRVLERGQKTFNIQVGERQEVVSVDRIKVHQGEDDPPVAQPPRRGRPLAT